MSDETRTVTVEQLAAALRKGEPGQQPINMFADPFDDADADDVAAAIFAALPTSTEGLDRARLATAIRMAEQGQADRLGVVGPATNGPPPEWYDGYAGRIAATYASLSPSPTEENPSNE